MALVGFEARHSKSARVSRALSHVILSLSLMGLLVSPALSLVEPEVEEWQKLLGFTEEILPPFGGELVTEALQEFGQMGSAMMSAPLSELMVELEQRRGLKFKYFTPWHVKDKRELRRFIRKELEKEYSPQKREEEEAVLKVLGLVPLDFHLIKFMEELLTDAVAGVYDPTADQFFLVDMSQGQSLSEALQARVTSGLVGDTTSVVIIHELDHALGGQHFGLRTTFEKLLKEATMDQRLAVQALVEGDATFVMIDHQHKQPAHLAGAKTLIAGTDLMTDFLVKFPVPLPGMGKFAEAPLFFKKSLIFPYYGGAEFISEVRLNGGWEKVNKAYFELPHSTEQIFHPRDYRYIQRKPDHPNFDRLPETFGEWKKVKDETGGEFLLRVVLEQYGVETYREAAQGWNGDRLRVYRHQKTGALGFYWAIRWDHRFEAQEFYQSLGSHLPFVVEQEEKLSFLSLAFTEDDLAKFRKALGETI